MALTDQSVVEAPTTLRDVRLAIPAELRRPDHGRAAGVIAVVAAQVVVAVSVAAAVWATGWWLLAPISWLVSSIAMCALVVLGHDCGHGSLLRSRNAMDALGHVTMSIVGYPYWGWKYSHDAHHRHTNQLGKGEGIYFDNAWNPELVDVYADLDGGRRMIYRACRTFPPLGSLLHMLAYCWPPTRFRAGRQRRRVTFSVVIAAATAVSIVAGLWLGLGSPLAVLHFWVIPAVGFHAWMALYTYLHHTADDVTFHEADEWNPFRAQVEGTVNVFAPRWVSALHLNIDVHVPHHVSTNVPSYHLRAANAALANSEWGPHLRERRLTVGYLHAQVARCRLWSIRDSGYERFGAERSN
ncbi:MAG: fatty acid desaturase [Acidimicrobiales bacterium]|nr:fatty acid desaturase [Acidimicrobiales bacterium]